MRIVHSYLQSDSHLKVITPIRNILNRYNISYKYKENLKSAIATFKYQIEFHLYEDNPNFFDVKKEIDKFDIYTYAGTVYERSDIETAEWFIILTGQYQYPQPENDFSYRKATFNLDDYCTLCDIGKIQNAPFRLKTAPKQNKNHFWGLHWEYSAVFVSQETKNILEREKIKGIRFSNPVLNKKNIPIKDLYQLHIDTILTTGFDSYNTKQITCKINNEEDCNTDVTLTYCGRIKFHHPKIGGYLFDKAIFNPEFDIVQSNEYFGSGGSAARIQIVSKRFKELVEKYNLKGLSFTPIVYNRFIR